MCSPIDRPVRGSTLRGISGTSWPGRRPASALSRCAGVLARLSVSSVSRSPSLTAIGASDARVGAAGDAGLDLAEGDLVGHQDGRLEAGAAGLLHVVGRGRAAEQAGPEHRLAGEVEVAAVLEHGAGGHLAHPLTRQAEPGDQALERGGQHVLVGGPRVGAVGAGERDAVAADDGGAAGLRTAVGRPRGPRFSPEVGSRRWIEY